nr:hypothetical protein [Mucilaginibacter sp. SP1R1]
MYTSILSANRVFTSVKSLNILKATGGKQLFIELTTNFNHHYSKLTTGLPGL